MKFNFIIDTPEYTLVEKYNEKESKDFLELYEENELRPIEIKLSDLESVNGNHIIYGLWECFVQSDNCPMFIWETKADDIILRWEL